MVNMMEQYYKSKAKNMYEMRSIRHDIQAHMIVLQYYLDKEKYEDAKEYLKAMRVYHHFQNEPMTETGNDLVNAIVYDVLCSRKEKIKVNCSGYIPENIKIRDFDLCTLFSNLFTNASEACDKLLFYEREISLCMQIDGEDFLISMSNPIEWDLDKNILGVSTTKEDKSAHGYGVKNIKKTVEKYGGTLDFGIENKTFNVNIRIPAILSLK